MRLPSLCRSCKASGMPFTWPEGVKGKVCGPPPHPTVLSLPLHEEIYSVAAHRTHLAQKTQKLILLRTSLWLKSKRMATQGPARAPKVPSSTKNHYQDQNSFVLGGCDQALRAQHPLQHHVQVPRPGLVLGQ